MDRMVYIAMTGAKQNMLAQSITANNLANISTTGFRRPFSGKKYAGVWRFRISFTRVFDDRKTGHRF